METHDTLITGGAEFIETNLATELRNCGHHMLAADLRAEEYVGADVRSYRQVGKLFNDRQFNYYHLAAEYGRWNGEDYYENL